MHNSLSKLYAVVLFMIVAFPKSFLIVKLLLLLPLIIIIIIITLLNNNTCIKWKSLAFYFAFISLSLIWNFIGQMYGNSSLAAIGFIRLYVAFFIIYMFLFIGLEEIDYVKLFLTVVCYSSLVICAVNIVFFIQMFMGIDILPLFIADQLGVGVDANAGDLRSGLNNVTTLFFISPILLCLLVFDNVFANEKKTLLFIAVFCCFVSSIASGRRTLILLMFISPMLFILFRSFFDSIRGRIIIFNIKLRLLVFIYALPIFLFVFLFIYFKFDVTALQERLFALTDASSQNERITQFYALLEGVYERPFLGHGLGSVSSVIRSVESPWSYELFYMKVLFDGGIVGFTLLFSLVFYYFNSAYKNLRKFNHAKTEAYIILFGILMFSAASATNPYFSGFDTLYILCFLPLLSVSTRYR